MRGFQFIFSAFLLVQFSQYSLQQEQDAPENLIAEGFFILDRKSLDLYMREEGNCLDMARDSAVEDVKFFLTYVNTIFDSLQRYGLNIQLRTVDIQVLDKDIYNEYYMTTSAGRVDSNYTMTTLQNFLHGDEVSRKKNEYDFAIFFTGYDIHDAIAGLATQNTTCNEGEAYGVVEMNGIMDTAITLAHEIGHLFGAEHDPNDTVTIMAPMHGPTYDLDQYLFSNLSAQAMKEYFSQNSHSNCLRRTDCMSKIPDVTPQNYKGKLQNVKTICERAIAPGSHVCTSSFYYNGELQGDSMCRALACRQPDNTTICTMVTPTEGLPCGLDKACSKGFCVPDKRQLTENVNPQCLWGDDPTPIGEEGKDCKYLLSTHGYPLCQGLQVVSSCCEECQTRETNITGCPYGDYPHVTIASQDYTCAEAFARYGATAVCFPGTLPATTCCQSCDTFNAQSDACLYGDTPGITINGVTMTCSEIVSVASTSYVCEENETLKRLCCQTCSDLNGK